MPHGPHAEDGHDGGRYANHASEVSREVQKAGGIPSICLRFLLPQLVSKGIYHYWIFFTWNLKEAGGICQRELELAKLQSDRKNMSSTQSNSSDLFKLLLLVLSS